VLFYVTNVTVQLDTNSDFCFKQNKRTLNSYTLIQSEQTTIIDVRSSYEFSNGSARGSINIPLDKLTENLEDLKSLPAIVLCCNSGNRSAHAAEYLKAKGVENVYNGGDQDLVDSQKQ
jgi:rhodanese-related sulfurtransferase